MSYLEDLTFETVEKAIIVVAGDQIKEVLESYWPTDEAIKEVPCLAESESALAWALDGFSDNNHDSSGEAGTEMVCVLLDMAVERLDPSLAEDYDPLVCPDCGSANIAVMGWFNQQTRTESSEHDSDAMCNDCSWGVAGVDDRREWRELIRQSKFTK